MSKKVIGFKMMVGDWILDEDPFEIFDMNVPSIGASVITGDNTLTPEYDIPVPPNVMFSLDRETTIMGFKFEEPISVEDLPPQMVDIAQGIEVGVSNLELIFEES